MIKEKQAEIESILNEKNQIFTAEELEEAMQKVMDTYAGGIGSNYQYNERQLDMAKEKIEHLISLTLNLAAEDMHELMFIYELKERLTLCLSVIAHLKARKETSWHSFAENLDYPSKSDEYFKYVNSKVVDGKIQIIFRDVYKRQGEKIMKIRKIISLGLIALFVLGAFSGCGKNSNTESDAKKAKMCIRDRGNA